MLIACLSMHTSACKVERDGSVFLHGAFYTHVLTSGVLNVPQPSVLPRNDTLVPYLLVSADAFPLSSYLFKPYDIEVPKGSPKRVITTTSALYSRKCIWVVGLSVQNISQATHCQTFYS
jgi:hypothetical protein